MIIIIPLGGTGEKFKENGYKRPKALIKIFGKPILYYLLDNLNISTIQFVCIPYNKEYEKYNFEKQLIYDYPHINFKFIQLIKTTEGAAETIHIALNTFSCIDCPVLCLDGDNFYTTDIISLWKGQNKIFTFDDLNDTEIYSYIKIKNNQVVNIVEKNKISNMACSGAYGFESFKQLLYYTKQILDKKIKQKGEYYISTVISEMVKDVIFEYQMIDLNQYHCLGTPIQVKFFYNNFPKISCLNNVNNIKCLRICFDLDTLVTYPTNGDYTTVMPIDKNIKLLKYLKQFQHIIILHTSRTMTNNIGKITFDTLEKFNIPYDEIYFGKPKADIIIDSNSINCFDIEKELGFYMDIVEPREFNQIEYNSIGIITKKSENLSGEIFYYRNIPNTLKDLFPLLIDYDIGNKWFKLEKIQGLTMTNLYLSELLKEDTLIHVMNAIRRIQSTPIIDDNINIYENYSNKLKKRYKSYDYSKFLNNKNIYKNLIEELDDYEKNMLGKKVVIHGDAVMTNILINNFGKVKCIDMRGKLGDTLTILGDWLYDWAKLYQSLIGYDKILQDKIINEDYEEYMILTFETYFLNYYTEKDLENVKLITKSLLFSLIPLHNNDKCFKYYDIISRI